MKNLARHRAFMNFPIFLLVFYLARAGHAGGSIPGLELSMPPSHIALSGDLHIQITSSSFPPLMLQLSRLEGNVAQPLTTFPVLPEARALTLNTTMVKIPCGYFSRGGQYYVVLKKQPIGNSTSNDQITRSLDVRWPMPQLSLTPEHIQTYPEGPVMAILEFPEVVCPPVAQSPASAIPEFWLELHYCGHSLLTCDNDENRQNHTNVQVLDQVRGFRGRRVFTLRCELFGLAGFYALFLRPTATTHLLPHTAAYVKADWSEQFVFNVHARSIFPCDVHSGGITVLFQYPSCILASGDRVRLFARLRANVASLAPPTTLEYVAEKRVIRGQHSLHFDCDLFTERYVEYCFVYVSQAINDAVADVRMDCVPTLPVTENESGGWGPWSPWSKCSNTCIGGTRSRYRFCDSPPPRYGAKFCEGHAVETEKCGKSMGNNWECFYGVSAGDIASEIPEIQNEVGPYCRCGCVVHLGQAKPKRLLATSSQSCPGRTFWLIQADDDFIIQFNVEQFNLPCGTQWLKVRDGSSLSANLLADLSGAPDTTPSIVNSTGPNLLLEFFSDEIAVGGQICGGGFLAHASQIGLNKSNVSVVPIAQSVGVVPAAILKLTAVHIAAIFFLSGLLIATALLGAQYLFRYRKYQVAQAEDQDSLADPTASWASITARTRASSSATLLSEVISLTRLRPHVKTKNKHSRLRESIDCEEQQEQEVTLAQEEDSLSLSSTTTLTQQETLQQTASEMESPESCTLKRSATLTSEKDKTSEKDDKSTPSVISRRLSNVSTATMTHVRASSEIASKSDPGFYSPASSLASTATIRSTNAKERKDKMNREKLLAAGSDFSIVGPDNDLEMDYYDYNVINAGAAPGSYLGMDPAFLVWIPPLDEDGEILPTDEDLKPRLYIDPGSNKESPEEEMLLPKPDKSELTCSPDLNNKIREFVQGGEKEMEPLLDKTVVAIQLHELPKAKRLKEELEKETKVEKSPSIDSNILEEIKFVDDDDDLTENQCNIEKSYQDSNIITSS